MRISSLHLAATAAAVALGAAEPAWAVQSFADFTGTATITDVTGYYGTPGAVFTTAFDLTFSLNDKTVGASFTSGSLPGVPAIQDLSGADDANPLRGTLIFADGTEFDAGHNYGPPDGSAFGAVGRAVVDPTVDPSFGVPPGGLLLYTTQSLIQDPGFTFQSYMEIEVSSPSNFGQVGVDWNKPFTYAFGPDDSVLFADGEFVDGDPNNPVVDVKYSFAPTTLTVTSDEKIGAVPEPGAWALMILGFGGVGSALRRRRRSQACRVLLQTI